MIWLIYFWRDTLEDDHPSYLPEIEALAQKTDKAGHQVRTERMEFASGRRLWDQMIEKTLELMACSDLSLSDRCAFIVSHSLLAGDTFMAEDAYISDSACDHPKGALPCIGLMYL